MRSQQGSRRIVVGDVRYRWRVAGNDGYISIGIWPVELEGSYQIVITNRIIRRIIEHAISAHGYNPRVQGKDLNLPLLGHVIKWDDAVRGT